MKLKILPPHLRNKKRYLAFEVRSQNPLTRDEVISLIWGAAGGLYGSCGVSRFDLWVVKVWKCNSSGQNITKGILRCRREEVDRVRSVFPVINRFKGKRVVFHTLGVSGTIKSARRKFIKEGSQSLF
ncbi:MAG: ribonuclease P [Methanobacteriaceae archaeon]|jgi:ribonuclease P/MRP protein subunit POP5|nr:ribonuclease P [Methanobacteriaceae archaeon]OPY24405.1 MAG: Ribonuclease P protein component 2 [Methanobacterium sp. PtaU1.Bin097]